MNPMVIFGDPIPAAIAALQTGLSALGESGVSFGTNPPTTPADGRPGRPYVQLAIDGTTGKYPALLTATVRVSVWHMSEPKAFSLSQLARAVLLSNAGDTAVRGWGEGIGPAVGTDTDDGPFSTFTVAARLRPTPIGDTP